MASHFARASRPVAQMSDRDVRLAEIVVPPKPGEAPDPTGEANSIGLSEDDSDLTALGLLEQFKRDRGLQLELLNQAERREKIVLGQHWYGYDPLFESTITENAAPDNFVSENLLFSLVLTYGARVRQDLETPRVFAVHALPEEIEAAQAGDHVLDYERRRCDEDSLGDDALFQAQCAGDALFYPVWNESDGPHLVHRQAVDEEPGPMGADGQPTTIPVPRVDAQGQPVYEDRYEYGAIKEEVIKASNYWTDGVDEYNDASYLVVRRIISREVASKRLRRAGFNVRPAANSYDRSPVGIARIGVEAFEVWCKPGARFEAGLYMLVIGGYVVKAVPYPLDHNELPGDVFKIAKVSDSPRGKTHVADAIPQQLLVNRTLRSIHRRVDVAGDVALAGPSGAIDSWTLSGRKRMHTDLPKERDPRYIEGPEVPATLFTAYNNARRSVYDTFGQSEATTTGGDPTDTQSGEQLKTAAALDAQKIAPVRRNYNKARRRVARQKLALARQFWDDARLIHVVGLDGVDGAVYIKGADLQGADVALEDGSGRHASHLGQQAGAEQAGAAGYIDPKAAGERRTTGLPTTVSDAATMIALDNQARAALQGKPQTPLPNVDVSTAVQHLTAVLHSAMGTTGHRDVLLQLIAAYQAPPPSPQGAPATPQPPPQGGAPQPSNGPGRMSPSVQQQAGPKRGVVDTTANISQAVGAPS